MPIYKDGASPPAIKCISQTGHPRNVNRILMVDSAGQEHSIWQTKTKVTFKSYDGGTMYSTAFYNIGDDVVIPDIQPSRSNSETETTKTYYEFIGWSINKNSTTTSTIETVGKNDIVYYAAYSQTYEYKVTFKSYDGSTQYSSAWYSAGQTVTKPASQSRSSSVSGLTYTFAGWATTVDATTGIGKDTGITAPDHAVTYYAAFSMTRIIVNGTTKYSAFNQGTYGKINAGYTQANTNLPDDVKEYKNNIFIVFYSANSSYGKCQYASTGISLNEIKKYNTLTVKYHGNTSTKLPTYDIGLWGSGSGMTSTNAIIKKSVESTTGQKTVTISLSSLKQLTSPATVYFGFGVIGAGTSETLCVLDSVVFTS